MALAVSALFVLLLMAATHGRSIGGVADRQPLGSAAATGGGVDSVLAGSTARSFMLLLSDGVVLAFVAVPTVAILLAGKITFF